MFNHIFNIILLFLCEHGYSEGLTAVFKTPKTWNFSTITLEHLEQPLLEKLLGRVPEEVQDLDRNFLRLA